MAAVSGNFLITRGDTYTETWTITDENAVAVDLTGGKLYLSLKNSIADADPGALQLTSPSSGIVLTTPASGIATLTITAAQTAALNVQTYQYDIQYKDAAGKITTLARGQMTVEADVTVSTA